MNDLLQKMAPLFGLKEVVFEDGNRQYKEHGAKTPIGARETLTKDDVAMIAKTIGFGSIILNLGKVDYSRGARQDAERQKSFWLLDGRRVEISMSDAGIISSVTNEPDKNIPPASFLVEQTPSGVAKCIHPECNIMIDRSKKKSGACSKAHMNFECLHQKCVERAQANGWDKATHPFGTKIAKDHWQYRKQ